MAYARSTQEVLSHMKFQYNNNSSSTTNPLSSASSSYYSRRASPSSTHTSSMPQQHIHFVPILEHHPQPSPSAGGDADDGTLSLPQHQHTQYQLSPCDRPLTLSLHNTQHNSQSVSEYGGSSNSCHTMNHPSLSLVGYLYNQQQQHGPLIAGTQTSSLPAAAPHSSTVSSTFTQNVTTQSPSATPRPRVEGRWGSRWLLAEVVERYSGAYKVRWLPCGSEETLLDRDVREVTKTEKKKKRMRESTRTHMEESTNNYTADDVDLISPPPHVLFPEQDDMMEDGTDIEDSLSSVATVLAVTSTPTHYNNNNHNDNTSKDAAPHEMISKSMDMMNKHASNTTPVQAPVQVGQLRRFLDDDTFIYVEEIVDHYQCVKVSWCCLAEDGYTILRTAPPHHEGGGHMTKKQRISRVMNTTSEKTITSSLNGILPVVSSNKTSSVAAAASFLSYTKAALSVLLNVIEKNQLQHIFVI